MSIGGTVQQTALGSFTSNAFGDHYLPAINKNLFRDSDASTVFRSYYGELLFEENTFYIITGTDSGLLYQHIKNHGIPKGSRYLFVELPQVSALLQEIVHQPTGDSPLELVVTDGQNWLEQAREMEAHKYAALKRLTSLRSLGVVHGHYAAYQAFWSQFKKEFDTFIREQNSLLDIHRFIRCQIENLTENQIPAICLKETFTDKTAVVLAGGPSLDALLPWVKQHRKDLLVIAVSRISSSLLRADIQPDIIVSIDPHPINLNVCLDMLEFQDRTLLVNDYHLASNLLTSWGGKTAFTGDRYPWPTPRQPKNLSPTRGATVTNNCMAIAVELGVTQIILGGVDSCFDQQGYTHATGSAEHTTGPMLQLSDQQVETNSGIMADTMHAFVVAANSIDIDAQDAITRGCRTINPAPGAMRLPHVEHISVDRIQIEPMEKTAREILTDTVPFSDANSRTLLYKEVLSEVDRVLKELKAIIVLSKKALDYNRKLFARKGADIGFHNKEKVERIENQLNTKYSDTCLFVRRFGIQRFIPILRLDDDRYAEDLEESCELYHQALVDTCIEIIDILRLSRTRTLSRIEEEKPQPRLKYLLKQWRNDQQPGRAILWEKQHRNYIHQQPEAQQQELREFMDSFDAVVEELGRQYITRIEQGTDLEGTANKAREYFMVNDQEALARLLTTLKAHQDKKRAEHFVPLIQGYIAELADEPAKAIEAYQNTTEGPASINALIRLFELHTNVNNLPMALDVLKKLSEINSTYIPMFADMLHVTGKTDDAVERYTDYLLSNPDDLDAMMKLGKIFLDTGSAEGVSWAMGYILEKDPEHAAARQLVESLTQPQASPE